MPRAAWSAAGVVVIALSAACAQPAPPPPTGPVAFDTATAWFATGSDSAALLVEVARTYAQHERGLAGRAALDTDAGMLFLFDALRTPDDGFWMWDTHFPVDIAFVGVSGEIVEIFPMEACVSEDEDDCPGYFPTVDYVTAIEANRGWFARNGVAVGARVNVVY